MTDGILLAEIQRDRELLRYDTIIIDEAHERSLNIDFLLGYLKQLLPRRPDLKVIITSATIDPRGSPSTSATRRSSRCRAAPTRSRCATGRSSTRTTAEPDEDRDQTSAICDAVDELMREGPGDILVFLSGEREIRDTADALRQHLARSASRSRCCRCTRGCPPPSSTGCSRRTDGRRVVLATNVAETSLTVPGIRYVVDPGTARISRYSHRLKVQRLPIEAVSRPAPTSGPGRCGRRRDGICIRLYSEEDFLAPAGVHRAGDPAHQPGVGHPADDRARARRHRARSRSSSRRTAARCKDGVALLEELGALDPREPDVHKRLTPLGRKLARLPVDPRLGRMVLEADRNGCVREVLVIAAALSIQDPRERPPDQQQAADETHRRFADDRSDFLAYLNLWRYLQEQQKALSASAFRRMCRTEFLNYLRVREWQDLVGQLRQVARSLGISTTGELSQPGDDPQPVHTVAAGRPALAHRPAGPGQARVPRRARRPVRALARARRCSRSRRAG